MRYLDDMLSFREQTALITGAASGIGRATALRFAEAGADLLLLDVNADGLDETVRLARIRGVEAQTAVVDLGRLEGIRAFWESTRKPYPSVLVNNAGIYPMREFLEVDADYLDTVMAVNLESVFWMCQEFVHRREGRGGAIINVSSIEALLPFKDRLVPYSVSKAGVIALTRALARDFGRKRFRVNVILPGAIKTPGTQGLMRTAIRQVNFGLLKTGYDFQARLPLGRWGEPDEVAKVVVFLASDMASYIQGAVVPVDGGFLLS